MLLNIDRVPYKATQNYSCYDQASPLSKTVCRSDCFHCDRADGGGYAGYLFV